MRVALISVCGGFLEGAADWDQKIHTLQRKLIENGFDIAYNIILPPDREEIKQALEYIKLSVNNCIVMGNVEVFREFAEETSGFDAQSIVVIDGVEFILMPEFNEEEFRFILPLLSSKTKTAYNTFRIKTFGLSEGEIRELIKDHLKNKNRINIMLNPSLMECEVCIRYSSKMAKMAVDEVIAEVVTKLNDYIYACSDTTLSERAFELIKHRDVSVAIAESFTGGLLTAEIVKMPGASNYLFEGLVAYSNDSKISRLGVEENIISEFGAVSIEAVYEMAASMMLSYPADLVIATSGNAGPTAEKSGEEGICYIAVGDKNAIHVYSYKFGGSRIENMESGVKCALYHIIKKLKSSDPYGII